MCLSTPAPALGPLLDRLLSTHTSPPPTSPPRPLPENIPETVSKRPGPLPLSTRHRRSGSAGRGARRLRARG
eukprot:3678818-Rhodomonas_salina.1